MNDFQAPPAYPVIAGMPLDEARQRLAAITRPPTRTTSTSVTVPTVTIDMPQAVEVGDAHLADGVRTFLASLGLDPDSDEIRDTPARVVRALREMTDGYGLNPADVLGRTFDVEHTDEMIVLRGIDFTSMCAHHLLPFTGTATVAYLPAPDGRVVGLSKLARLVDLYAHRLQTQEQLTGQITAAIDEHLDTIGAACVIRSTHACMTVRGVRKPGAVMVTSSLTGIFREPAVRAELLALDRQP